MALAEANAQYATGVYFRLTQGGVLQHVQPGQLTDLLRRTRLPDPVLATMWQIANPNSLPLDKDGISGVLRLVSCFQNQLDWQTLAPSEPATNVGVRVEAKPMLSGQGNASRTSLNSEVAMEEADFRLTPAEKFEAESAFQKYSNGTTHVRVGGLEELYLKSGLQRTDWNKICELIDWQKLGQIDQNQMSYLLHLVNERKRGRRLPTSIPSDVILAIYLGANKGSSGSSGG
ncbi:hypothetical protein DFJ74DRAFT_704272 [Hyaloraphidium curvatum]|nr:hypothetical protein DFJ74DRAFT_704272 [Hyaloraphidium curvatum]